MPMFSPELEALIQATLADGVLTENEKLALVRRAEKEGVDLAELEIYIDSLIQKRIQTETMSNQDKIMSGREMSVIVVENRFLRLLELVLAVEQSLALMKQLEIKS